MPTEIKLPNLGDGVDSGDVLEVLVKEGDTIAKDQGIIEIETGKATMQVPSSAAGKVLKVHVSAGQSIPVGALLLTIEGVAGGTSAAPAKPAPAAAKPAAPAKPAPAKPAAAKPAPPAENPQPAAAAPKPAPAKPAPTKPAPAPGPEPDQAVATQTATLPEPTHDGGVAAGPAVRRFAREVGVDLARVTGSGPSGRITRDDVLAVVRQSSQSAASGATAKGRGSTATESDAWGPIRVEKRKPLPARVAKAADGVALTPMHPSVAPSRSVR